MNKHSSYIMGRFGISESDFVRCVCLDYDMSIYNYMNSKFIIGGVYQCFCVECVSVDYYVYDLEFYFINRFSVEDFNINFRLLSEMRQSRIDEIFND
jgi:isochorismate hydrolase